MSAAKEKRKNDISRLVTICLDSMGLHDVRWWSASHVDGDPIMKSDGTAGAAKLPRRLIRLPEVLSRTGLSRSEWYRLMTLGRAPAAIPLGERIRAWDECEISAWIESRIAARLLARPRLQPGMPMDAQFVKAGCQADEVAAEAE